MRRLFAPLIALVLALLLAPSAHAGWFGADVVDGPAAIDSLGDVDLARDGSGGLVYVKRDAGVAPGLPLAPGRGRLAAAGEALQRRAGHRGGRDGDRRRPPGRGLGRRRRGVGDRDPGRQAGPGARAPGAAGRRRREQRRDRHGHQRGRLRRLVGGRRRARRAPGRHRLDAAGRPAGRRRLARRPAPARCCARASPSAPRATPSPPGRRPTRTGATTSSRAASRA